MVKQRIGRQLTRWLCLCLLVMLAGVWLRPDVRAEDPEPLANYPVVHTVTSSSDQVVSKTFSVSAESVSDFYQASYHYEANFQTGGYVAVTDAAGNELYKSDTSGSFSGEITLSAGKTYTMTACGGPNGSATVTVRYTERLKSGFNHIVKRYGMDRLDDHGVRNVTNLYLPTMGLNPGIFQTNQLGENSVWNINTKNDLLVRPYDINVYFEFTKNRDAYFKIVRCDDQGNTGETIASGGSTSGNFTIYKGQGILVSTNSGHDHTEWDRDDIGGNTEMRLRYRLDEAAPNAPVLNVKNLDNIDIVKLGAKIRAKEPVVLQWETPPDNATVLPDQTLIGPGGVVRYRLDIFQKNSLFRSDWIVDNPAGNLYIPELPEGEYLLKLRAVDLDNNESPESNTLNIVVDHSVGKVKLDASAVTINYNKLAVEWDPVEDSDLKEYHLALTTVKQAPGEAQVTTTETRAEFANLSLHKSYFVWVRAVDQVGNKGAWAMAGPFNLSGQPVNLTAVPQATLGTNLQPQYQVILYIHSSMAGSYIVQRQAEGGGTRETVANLTYEQLAQNHFQVVDRDGISKHGQYTYFVTHQSGTDSNTYLSETVTIPNLSAGFSVSGPEDQATTTSFTHTIDITPKTDYEGDALKFKVWYRQNQGESKSSGVFVAGPVEVTFPTAGQWEWWVEVGEFHNNQLIAKHSLATSQVLFIRSSVAYLSDGTPVAKDQPRYEASAPGFGQAVRVEYRATMVPTNPFFTSGVDDWTLDVATGTSAVKESVAGGSFGGKVAKLTISQSGFLANQIQFYKALGSVSSDAKIACQIRARASIPTNAAVLKCSNDGAPGESFGSLPLNLTTEYQTFKFVAVATSATTARIGLDLGNVPAGTVIEIDYICCETGKVHPTSPHDSSRSLENLKISTLGMSPAAGTWEQLVYVDSLVKRTGTTLYNRIFSIPQANGNSGINVYHATASSVWDLESYNDAGSGCWLASPISDSVTKANQWYRFRVTWCATETKLQIFEVATGTLVAERKRTNPKLPTAFAPYAYVGNTGLSSFPETLHDDIRISKIVRTDSPDYTKPLPVDADTILKVNLDGTLEPESSQPAVRQLTIAPATVSEVTLPLFFETSPGKPLQLTAQVNLTGQAAEYRWTPGDGGAEFTGEQPVYTYNQLGDYTLTLKVKDATGKLYTATSTVKIRNSTSGTVTVNETWSGIHQVSGTVVIAAGTTLTLQPGTILYMTPGSSLKVEGNLQAVDANQGIVIGTEDGSLWEGLVISGSGTVSLNGVTVQGAKIGLACIGSGQVNLNKTTLQNCQTALHAYSGTIKASGCTFKQNWIYGVKEDNGCSPALTNCQFQANGIHYYDEQLYYLTVTQLNTGGNSGNVFSDGTLDAPVINNVTVAAGQATIYWNGVSNAVGYKIRYGTASGNYERAVVLGNLTSFTITGLEDQATYYVVVTAVNGSGGESSSAEKVVNLTTMLNAPVLTELTAANESVKLSWTVVPGATGYRIKYGTSSGNYSQTLNEIGNVTSWQVDQLTNNTTYYFVVSAINALGESGNSVEQSIKTGLLPETPGIIEAVAGDSSVCLTWNKVTNATGYKVKYGALSGKYARTINAAEVTSYNITGLANHVPYYFVVSAYNDFGESSVSDEVIAKPLVSGEKRGRIIAEYWHNISGLYVSNLTSALAFPETPSQRIYLYRMAVPSNNGNYYGVRMRGYLHPPVSGSYTFKITSDDTSELWLSVDENPENKQKIAWVPGVSGWSDNTPLKSEPVNLESGKKYYIEILFKENSRDDWCEVAWQIPGGSFETIPGRYLSPYYGDTDSLIADYWGGIGGNYVTDLTGQPRLRLQIIEAR